MLDMASSHTYLKINSPCYNFRRTKNEVDVSLPNNQIIHSTHMAEVHIPQLPLQAQTANIFPELSKSSSISIAQLCDDGCEVLLIKTYSKLSKDGVLILVVKINITERMWDINLRDLCFSLEKGTNK